MTPSSNGSTQDALVRAWLRKRRGQISPIYKPNSQQQVWVEITDWLREMEVDDFTFVSITVESVRGLITRLVHLAEPNLVLACSDTPLAHWGQEFKATLEKLKYPHAHNVSPHWVYHPTDRSEIWPCILSVLYWLTNKGKVRVGLQRFTVPVPKIPPRKAGHSSLVFRYDYWGNPEDDCTLQLSPQAILEDPELYFQEFLLECGKSGST